MCLCVRMLKHEDEDKKMYIQVKRLCVRTFHEHDWAQLGNIKVKLKHIFLQYYVLSPTISNVEGLKGKF